MMILITALLDVRVALGQGSASGVDIKRSIPPVRISVGSAYQSMKNDDVTITEFSAPISAQLLLLPDLALGVGVSQASVSGMAWSV